MKTKKMLAILVLVLVLGFVGSAKAGWTTSGNHMYSDVVGNVGIGTTSPKCKLGVIASSSDSENEWAPAVYGRNNGEGDGVYGWSQRRHGVYGVTKSTGAERAGVYGWNQGSGNVTNYGGYFRTDGDTGAGVCGIANAVNGKGVFGRTSGNYGEAVRGKATGTHAEGVMGEALGPQGDGVSGWGKRHDFYAWGPGEDYGSASSIRWKSDIRPIDAPLDKVLLLRGVYFTWDEEHGGEHDVGMIAEEVGEVLPEIVSYEPDGQYTSGMDYSRLTPLLVEAVKALNRKTAELEDKLSKLESLRKENTDLHDRIKTLEALVDQLVREKSGLYD
jgi:hypothetical protein